MKWIHEIDSKPDAVGIEITVAPFVRNVCCGGLILFDVTDGGIETISSGVVAIGDIS